MNEIIEYEGEVYNLSRADDIYRYLSVHITPSSKVLSTLETLYAMAITPKNVTHVDDDSLPNWYLKLSRENKELKKKLKEAKRFLKPLVYHFTWTHDDNEEEIELLDDVTEFLKEVDN